MKYLKLSSVVFLSFLFICAFNSELSAKHHRRSHSSFGLSFNFGPSASIGYAATPAPVVAPAPVIAPAPVAVYNPYAVRPVAYPYTYYPTPVYIAPAPGMYVQPQISYSYWR